MKQFRNTQYRKVKTEDSYRYIVSKYPPYQRVPLKTVGKVHIQFKPVAKGNTWRFVCGKRDKEGAFANKTWVITDDIVKVTCLNCLKHGPEIVALFDEKMKPVWEAEQAELEALPSLEDFQ